MGHECSLRGDSLLYALKSGAESFGLDGLGQVVECVNVEGLEGIVIVRGYKYGDGHICYADLLDDFEAAAAGHLDVEEEHIESAVFESGDYFPAGAALSGDFYFLVGR